MNRSLRYEIGPIRPPSEAYSLLIRFTRNCPWNKCAFCSLYKGRRFQKRTLDEIKRDIDTIKQIKEEIKELSWRMGTAGNLDESILEKIYTPGSYNECFRSTALWLYFGGKNVFIQDANSLAMDPGVFTEALVYLKKTFPHIERVTSYARSRTIAKRWTVEALSAAKEAGLTRLHVGLESGSDFLLKYMDKGVTREEHIEAGRKVKEAGIELSEYVILGMGGKRWWREHAILTAETLNEIDPDFIRFRTLKVLKEMPLYERVERKDFLLSTEEDILLEEKELIEHLEGIGSYVKSDHILNLLEEVDGKLPDEKEKLLSVIDRYFTLSEEERLVYRFGRRAGIYRGLDDLKDELTYHKLKKQIREMEDREPGSLEKALSLLLENYI
ncbi:MAG: radical SAM protein [Syntrophorhabdaceae bacterium]|nr:radical SAM protein [Syntrophorhabdaceae bacterium]